MSHDGKHASADTKTTQPEITSDEENELEEEAKRKKEAEEKERLRSLDKRTKVSVASKWRFCKSETSRWQGW